MNRLHVHAVHGFGRHVVGFAQLVEFGHVGGAAHRSAHRVAVVLNHENDGQFPGHGHVQGFVKSALPHGAIAEEADADVARFVVFFGEGNTRPQRNLRPHDAVAAHEVTLLVEDVHRAALAFGRPSFLAKKLGHDGVRRGTQRQRNSVVAVSGDVFVVGREGRGRSRRAGFLSYIKVTESPDFLLAVELSCLLLEASL